MNMPNVDGRALIQHIRRRRASHALPVIVLSEQAGEDQRVAESNQGADDYLVKPVAARELLARAEVQILRARMCVADEARNARSLPWSDLPPRSANGQDGNDGKSLARNGRASSDDAMRVPQLAASCTIGHVYCLIDRTSRLAAASKVGSRRVMWASRHNKAPSPIAAAAASMTASQPPIRFDG